MSLDEEIPSTWNESWRFAQDTDLERWQGDDWQDYCDSHFEGDGGKHEVLHCPFSDTISSEADAEAALRWWQRTDCDVIEEVNHPAENVASRDEDVLQMVKKRKETHQFFENTSQVATEEASGASSAEVSHTYT